MGLLDRLRKKKVFPCNYEKTYQQMGFARFWKKEPFNVAQIMPNNSANDNNKRWIV